MSESTASHPASSADRAEGPIDPTPRSQSADELPFGVRAADFLLRNLLSVVLTTVFGAVLGAGAGMLLPRPYVDQAVIEIGVRFITEPIENPIQAGWRLQGALHDAARDMGVGLDDVVVHRREEKTNALTRFMDVSVRAKSASTARALLDRGIERLVGAHRGLHVYEKQILEAQLGALEASAERLESTARETAPWATVPAERETELDLLNAVLFDAYRSINGTRSILSDVRTPSTRVVGREAMVAREPSRVVVLTLAGTLFGLFLGLSLAGARSAASRSIPSSDLDPIVENLVTITRRNRATIAIVMLVMPVIGGGLGLLRKPSYEGTDVVAMARVEPEGPIIDLQAVDVQLESHVRRMAVSEHLTDATLEAMTVRDQPPSARKLPMIALKVTGQDPDAVRRDLDRALEHLRALEAPVLASEQQRLRQAARDLEAEVKWLSEAPVTARSQEALKSAILERTATQRGLSPARSYGSHVLASLPVEVASKRTTVLAFAMIGLVLGAFAGYMMAFLVEARRRLR